MIIAGPCAVESYEQILEIYEEIGQNIDYFRAGAYKPRTSVQSFQGLGEKGIEKLLTLKKEKKAKIVTEIVSVRDIEQFKEIDIIQIGARNMQNYELLKEVGKLKKVVLLKRGLAATFVEFIEAAKYLEEFGAKEVILCERGIRTISDTSRFTLDMSMVLKVKSETKYKIIVDPSHAAGKSEYVVPLAKAALAVGADGLIIEVHNNPECALSDSEQQILPKEYNKFINQIKE